MGYVDFVATSFHSASSPLETARFGIKTDRITIGENSRTVEPDLYRVALAVEELIRGSTASIKIVRFPSDLLPIIRTLAPLDDGILPAGALMYWEHSLDETLPSFPSDATNVLQFENRDAWRGEVMSIIENSFDGYVNHYSVNPLIPAGIIKDGYMEWATSTIAGSENLVFTVSDSREKAIGAAIVSVTHDVWEIELASIVRDSQRQGHYLHLMSRILSEARERKVSRVVISTQSHNIGVQRAWTRLGYSPVLSIETVHIVDRGLLATTAQFKK